MSDIEAVFEAVNDSGVSAESVAKEIGMRWDRAKERLERLSEEGRILRVRRNCGWVYFLTPEGVQKFMDDNLSGRAYEAIDERGVTSESLAQKMGISWKSAQRALHNLCKAKRVHRAKLTHKTVWYFRTKAEADAFVDSKRTLVVIPPTIAVRTRTSFDPDAQIVIPAGLKVQEGPAFKGLGFAEPANERGAFSSLGIGRYLPDEDAAMRRLARKAA